MGVRGEGKGAFALLDLDFFCFGRIFVSSKYMLTLHHYTHTRTHARTHARTHLPLPGKIPAGAPDSHIQAIKLFS